VEEAIRLQAAGRGPGTAEARKLAARFAQICKEEGYGEPRMHARWISEFADIPEAARAGWKYLAQI
jgi:hypothetical protein